MNPSARSKRSLSFAIPYIVNPKQSMRIGMRGSRPCSFQDPKVIRNADALAALMLPHRPESPLVGPIKESVRFVYPWLKKHPNKVRAGFLEKDTRPDIEQLLKQLNDVMERMGFFDNDAQVAVVEASKVFGPTPLVQIELAEIR